MDWIILIAAGFCETGFTFCLGKVKESPGLNSTLWFIGFIISLIVSMLLLYKAVQTLPIGTAYAVWTGIGAAGTVIAGLIFFKEPASFLRIFFLITLIISITGLKYASK